MSTDLYHAPTEAGAAGTDVIDFLAAFAIDGEIAQLRRRREEVRRATQGSFDALFGPVVDSDLLSVERELVALRIALIQRNDRLRTFHLARALERGVDPTLLLATEAQPGSATGNGRWPSILRFVDRLTREPAAARPVHLAELQQQGLSPRDIVTLAQLIAFVNFEVRLLAGLHALSVSKDTGRRKDQTTDATTLLRGKHPPVQETPSSQGFTTEPLEWDAWLPAVDLSEASADQRAVLDESHATARTSPYYLTLVHNPAVLRQRSKLFNAIMYGPGGLPRAERELATVGVSLLNGCPYCASVHARLFAQLTKEAQVIEALFEEGVNAALTPRRRAIVDLAVALSDNPPTEASAPMQKLRSLGLDELQILDAIHAVAIFAWANRLMQTLGEPVAVFRK